MKLSIVAIGVFGGILLFGAGCSGTLERLDREIVDSKMPVLTPVENYTFGARYKRFGEFFDDRFRGYHVGDDLEVKDEKTTVAVSSIAEGRVTFADWVEGYGGVIVINHAAPCRERFPESCQRVSAVYGHLNTQTFQVHVGDDVVPGQTIGYLGVQGPQTDNERSHLHFSIYRAEDVRLAGYVASPTALVDYINPRTFFGWHGLLGGGDDDLHKLSRLTEPSGRDVFPLEMSIPGSWDVEWISSLEAWNLYDTRGAGSARERSQIFIRYFDASSFLTLQTVTIHSATDLTVGDKHYTARQYDIEKKPNVRNFVDQPSWRNERHIVTDFRGEDGFTRYFVMAANPSLDQKVYDRILSGIHIVTEDDQSEHTD